MKRLLFFLTLLFTLALTMTGLAKEKPAPAPFNPALPSVAVIYVNNAQTTYDNRIDKFALENLHLAIPSSTYNYLEGSKYRENLSAAGIDDISTAERSDIIDALYGEDVDYLVYLEFMPITGREKRSVFSKGKIMNVVAPFKIIDVKNNRNLYNGRLNEQGKTTVMFGNIGNKSVGLEGVKLVNAKVAEIIAARLPKVKAEQAAPLAKSSNGQP